MARRLPWKNPGTPNGATDKTHSSNQSDNSVKTSCSTPPRAESPVLPRIRTHVTPIKKERFTGSDSIRSPSTSPPQAPPPEQRMIVGADKDDRFRMVEDEFLSIAQQFTKHLHHAEYDRLKAIAKRQNAATIREIERPVVAGAAMTATAKRRREESVRAAKQRKAEGAAAEDANSPWVGTNLQGLLDSPRRETRFLSSNFATSVKTRASAGFQPNGSPPKVRQRPDPRQSSAPLASSAASRTGTAHFDRDTSLSYAASRRKDLARTSPGVIDPEDDDEDPFGVKRRKIRREKSKEQLRRASDGPSARKASPDSIPAFL